MQHAHVCRRAEAHLGTPAAYIAVAATRLFLKRDGMRVSLRLHRQSCNRLLAANVSIVILFCLCTAAAGLSLLVTRRLLEGLRERAAAAASIGRKRGLAGMRFTLESMQARQNVVQYNIRLDCPPSDQPGCTGSSGECQDRKQADRLYCAAPRPTAVPCLTMLAHGWVFDRGKIMLIR